MTRRKTQVAHRDGEIDYLIVGSGPAGAVLAHELRRGGKRVVLLERGPFTVPGAMETRLVDELKESSGTRSSTDGAIFIRNGMAVGGGSLVNVDLCFAPTLPSIQAKIAGWRREGRIGNGDFTLDQLAKAYEWVKPAVGTRVLSESEINPNNRDVVGRRQGPRTASQAVRPQHLPAGPVAVPGDGQTVGRERVDPQSAAGRAESAEHDPRCGRAAGAVRRPLEGARAWK